MNLKQRNEFQDQRKTHKAPKLKQKKNKTVREETHTKEKTAKEKKKNFFKIIESLQKVRLKRNVRYHVSLRFSGVKYFKFLWFVEVIKAHW